MITANWLLGEAREQGLTLSDSELKRRVREQGEATIGGQAEFRATLAATKETSADASFETRAQWAASELRRLLGERAEKTARALVTAVRVESFYRSHIARYRVPELREFDLAEGFKSVAEADAFVGRGIGQTSPLARLAFHETYLRSDHFTGPAEKRRLLEAIFAARVGVASRPMPLDGRYVAFVVRHVRPGYVKPMAVVRTTIEGQLLAQSRHRAYEEMTSEYVRRWAAKTDCLAGYVVQQCSQYRGPLAHEELTYLAANQP
ncbi:MAG: peptidyl-prolyl cis-trans isomerase [Solirubrobacterales bacterium]|nr:peptidyl-prolyl cis-trans isomerase [Solirubrobacterales bacterium]